MLPSATAWARRQVGAGTRCREPAGIRGRIGAPIAFGPIGEVRLRPPAEARTVPRGPIARRPGARAENALRRFSRVRCLPPAPWSHTTDVVGATGPDGVVRGHRHGNLPDERSTDLSHIVAIQTEVRDGAAVAAACRRLGLPEPILGTAQLFSGPATGLLIKLPGWLYPVVAQTDTGQVQFDNYGGAWGQPEKLDRFLQAYAVEKAKIEARRKGYTVTEQPLADGSIRLSIQVGGAS